MTTPHIHGKGLCIDTPEGRPLLHELTFGIARDRVALIGRNGVGKSTLLRVLAGELPPSRGSLVMNVEPTFVRQQPRPDELARDLAWVQAHAARGLAHDLAALGLDPASLQADGLSRNPRDRIGPRRSGASRLADQLLGAICSHADRGPLEGGLVSCPMGPAHAREGDLSRGQARKISLLAAKYSGAELLLLDEPSEDLDEAGVAWLQAWLTSWDRGALVVTHHRALLRCFSDFFLLAESGCRHRRGSFDELQAELVREQAVLEQQYVRNLNVLARRERHHAQVIARRARKKNVGRIHELDRCTSRCRLNEKRGYAQQSQARVAKIREQRITAVRGWARATRRALSVELPLALRAPSLPPCNGHARVTLEQVGLTLGDRPLFRGVELRLHRQRLAITGPNGAGKTSLLRVMLGQLPPSSGRSHCRLDKLGVIGQGAPEWESDDSLLLRLAEHDAGASFEQLAARVVAHAFPLALAERPLRSLSPGERVRAALICLFQRAPEIDVLVLDEPSHALDFVGLAALERALRSWPGGLVVVSHDRELLDAIGIEQTLELDGQGGHRLREEKGQAWS